MQKQKISKRKSAERYPLNLQPISPCLLFPLQVHSVLPDYPGSLQAKSPRRLPHMYHGYQFQPANRIINYRVQLFNIENQLPNHLYLFCNYPTIHRLFPAYWPAPGLRRRRAHTADWQVLQEIFSQLLPSPSTTSSNL